MKRIIFIVIALALVAGGGYFAITKFTPRERAKTYRVGVLVRGETYRPGVEGFMAKMRELGYEEGKNIVYTVRFESNIAEFPKILSEFVNSGVDLIQTWSTPATVETHKFNKDIPIVFGSMGDPLASKVVESLQRPGKNVTGVGSQSSPLAGKRLEFLVELFPRIKRVAFPFTPTDIPGKSSLESATAAAEKLGVTIVQYVISKERDAKATALVITKRDVDGIVLSSDSVVWANLASYVEQAKRERLPFAVFDKDMVEKGGLVGYGPDYFFVGHQVATLVHKIFQGADPAELPVESPSRFILAVNLKTARDIGFTFPEEFLAKADLIVR